jgi:hypothetical protein
MKNAVTWNTKKPPSHSKSKTNPRTRNILCLLLTASSIVRPSYGLIDDLMIAGLKFGEKLSYRRSIPHLQSLGARNLHNVAFDF